MKLVFTKSANPPLPVHSRAGELLGFVCERRSIGFEADEIERAFLRPGTVLRVKAAVPGSLLVELEVMAEPEPSAADASPSGSGPAGGPRRDT